jgi:hypothetical protein
MFAKAPVTTSARGRGVLAVSGGSSGYSTVGISPVKEPRNVVMASTSSG